MSLQWSVHVSNCIGASVFLFVLTDNCCNCASYLFVVIVIVAYENHPNQDKSIYSILALVGYAVWLVLSISSYGMAWVTPQFWRWGGYPDISE